MKIETVMLSLLNHFPRSSAEIGVIRVARATVEGDNLAKT